MKKLYILFLILCFSSTYTMFKHPRNKLMVLLSPQDWAEYEKVKKLYFSPYYQACLKGKSMTSTEFDQHCVNLVLKK